DQRNTLNLGGDVTLPRRVYFSSNVYYGSDFSNAFPGAPYPGNYLPQHTTFDFSAGKDFGERFTASVTALNVANRRVEYDNSLTFGGYHWNNPREVYLELGYRFYYLLFRLIAFRKPSSVERLHFRLGESRRTRGSAAPLALL